MCPNVEEEPDPEPTPSGLLVNIPELLPQERNQPYVTPGSPGEVQFDNKENTAAPQDVEQVDSSGQLV